MATLRTGVLMAAITALFVAVGYILAGALGMFVAFAIAVTLNGFAYWNSDRLALAAHDAVEVDASSAPELVHLVADLAVKAGLPPPRVFLIDAAQPNAFATGRSPRHAAVVATTGLLRALTREEMAGVVAHELAHIRNRDTLLMTVAATFAGAVAMLGSFSYFARGRDGGIGPVGALVLALLAPLGAALIQMTISRTREFEADRIGAGICGEPLWLAAALAKIAAFAGRSDLERAETHPATAHLFIFNPLHARSFDRLFATHPPVEERIAALQAMAR